MIIYLFIYFKWVKRSQTLNVSVINTKIILITFLHNFIQTLKDQWLLAFFLLLLFIFKEIIVHVDNITCFSNKIFTLNIKKDFNFEKRKKKEGGMIVWMKIVIILFWNHFSLIDGTYWKTFSKLKLDVFKKKLTDVLMHWLKSDTYLLLLLFFFLLLIGCGGGPIRPWQCSKYL